MLAILYRNPFRVSCLYAESNIRDIRNLADDNANRKYQNHQRTTLQIVYSREKLTSSVPSSKIAEYPTVYTLTTLYIPNVSVFYIPTRDTHWQKSTKLKSFSFLVKSKRKVKI